MDSAPASPAAAPLAVVCCVEAGPLEAGVVRVAESLRRHGGALAGTPLLAITPRPGPPLARATRQAFARLEVRHAALRRRDPLAWNNFMNKPLALDWAVREGAAGVVAWLDSDVLVLREPVALALPGGEDFAAAAPDKNLGSTGPEDANDPYWREACRALGVDPDALPRLTTDLEGTRIRLYFNSGVFAFRAASGFAPAYLEDCRRLLAARVASRAAGIFFTDQVVLGLTAHRLGLAWSQLPHAYNRAVGSRSPEGFAPAVLAETVILHYHDALWPAQAGRLLEGLGEVRPDAAAWLAALGPLDNPQPVAGKLAARLLRWLRGRKLRAHLRRCRVF